MDASTKAPPPLAVVGSQVNRDEQIFGQAFDGQVIRRFLLFVWPRRGALFFALAAVVVFTLTQVAIPLVIRDVIDNTLQQDAVNGGSLNLAILTFVALVAVNYGANYLQLTVVGHTAERVLYGLRRASSTACAVPCTCICSGSPCRSWIRPRWAA
jgi:ATP-binding cassette subfamily B protein